MEIPCNSYKTLIFESRLNLNIEFEFDMFYYSGLVFKMGIFLNRIFYNKTALVLKRAALKQFI